MKSGEPREAAVPRAPARREGKAKAPRATVTGASQRTIAAGHSPDPDDAFMFYALATGKVTVEGLRIEHHLEDIQTLNERARSGQYELTAISVAAYPYVADRYWILSAGASVGVDYGPILVATRRLELDELRGRRIAIPGTMTTAYLALRLALGDVEVVVAPFDQIVEIVQRGDAEAGLLIHEGQLTYARWQLQKIFDVGRWWTQETGLPLPLGLDVVRQDLGKDLARRLRQGLQESIRYAQRHEEEALTYALSYGRGLDRDHGLRFVKMYVNAETYEMSDATREGLQLLLHRAFERRLIPCLPELTYI